MEQGKCISAVSGTKFLSLFKKRKWNLDTAMPSKSMDPKWYVITKTNVHIIYFEMLAMKNCWNGNLMVVPLILILFIYYMYV